MNVHACASGFLVCVELAGLDPGSLHVTATSRTVAIRGFRAAPNPCGDEPHRVLALEIDYGPFERVLALPLEIDPADVVARTDNGLVWIRLRLSGRGTKAASKVDGALESTHPEARTNEPAALGGGGSAPHPVRA